MEKKAHYFYALSLPKEAKITLNEQCSLLKTNFPFSRWVHYEDYHITLAFLGSAPKDKLQTSMELVNERVSNKNIFPQMIDHLGVFGKADSPRIFWAGVEEKNNSLIQIRDLVFSACTDVGFRLETRPFHPHITLARKWIGEYPFQKETLTAHNPFNEMPIHFEASEVVLYRTHLDRTPKYEAVEKFPFKG